MTTPSLYSMKWENYYSHVSDLFLQLLETGSMSDITLFAEGTRINCHKILLTACSPYFQEILSDVGQRNAAIVISGIKGEDVKSCIEFIYRGEISIKADRLCSVLKAAEALKICGLTEVSSGMTNSNDADTSNSSMIVNNQPESDNSSKRFFKRASSASLMSDECKKTIEKSAKDSNDQANNRKEDAEIIVCMPKNMLMLTEEDNDRENCKNSKVTGNNDVKQMRFCNNGDDDNTDTNHLTIKVETDDSPIRDCNNDLKVDNNLMIDEMRLFKKNCRKKMYSEEAMLAALEDMKSGKNLVTSAEKHCVPKTTLYCRAKAIGACSKITKRGYTREKMLNALQAVANGCSLQYASTEFGIPKTVLWRRVKNEFGNQCLYSRQIKISTCTPQFNSTAEDNVSIRRVSPQYQIPKATLFRWEKVCSVNDKSKFEGSQIQFMNSAENSINVEGINAEGLSKKITSEPLSVHSANVDGTIEVASSSVDQSNSDLQVNYLDNPEFSNSSIIILAPVDQQTVESKYTDLTGQIFVKNTDIEGECHLNEKMVQSLADQKD